MTFSDRIWSAAVKSWGALFTIIGLAVSVIGFFIVPSSQAVPLNIVVVLGLLIFVVLGIFIRAAYDANVDSTVSLPRDRKSVV